MDLDPGVVGRCLKAVCFGVVEAPRLRLAVSLETSRRNDK